MDSKKLSLEQRIRYHWDEFSSHEQQLADVLLATPGQLAMNTATELAKSAKVSKATASRFIRHLGYESYDEARRQARSMQNSGSPHYLQKIPTNSPIDSVIQTHLEKEVSNLVSSYRLLDGEQLEAMSRAIAEARRIVIIGWRHSQSIGQQIYRDLINIHSNVQLLPKAGDSMSEHIATLNSNDIAICIGLRRQMQILDTVMSALNELNVPMIYLADVLSGKPAKQARWVIRGHTEGSMIFDSTVALSGICNLLCSLVEQKMGRAGSDRLSQIEMTHQWLDELI